MALGFDHCPRWFKAHIFVAHRSFGSFALDGANNFIRRRRQHARARSREAISQGQLQLLDWRRAGNLRAAGLEYQPRQIYYRNMSGLNGAIVCCSMSPKVARMRSSRWLRNRLFVRLEQKWSAGPGNGAFGPSLFHLQQETGWVGLDIVNCLLDHYDDGQSTSDWWRLVHCIGVVATSAPIAVFRESRASPPPPAFFKPPLECPVRPLSL